MIRISKDPQGGTVSLKLTAYLGGTRFKAYRDACFAVGFRAVKEPSGWVNRGPIVAVAQLVRELERAGLTAEVDREVVDALKEHAGEARALLEAGRARVAAANDRLADRNLRLFRYQETGVEWLAPRKAAMLCDEMGLGKTVQVLIALPDKAAALVVAPKAVVYSWENEVNRWRPEMRVTIVSSKATFRWPAEGEVVITTYGMLPKDAGEVGAPPVGMALIADEAHALKNRKAQRTQAFQSAAAVTAAHNGKVWLVTGTPLLNRPPELWQLARVAGLEGEAFGNWYNFVRLFNGRKGRYAYEWGRPSTEVPDVLRKVMLHRRRQEVMRDLPGKIRSDIEVNGLDAETIAACDKLLERLDIDLALAAEGVDATRTGGIAFEEISRTRRLLAVSKIPAMLEMVAEYEEQDEPLVVFSCHREPIEALRGRDGWGIILGETSAEERGRLVDRFQRGELRGIAGTVQAMGVGVTLTRAHHVLQVDLAWTPALNNQAEDRVCRIGQKAHGVIIRRLVARHALDRRVTKLLTIKQAIIDKSVEAAAVEEDYATEAPAEKLVRDVEGIAGRVVDADARARAQEKARRERERDDERNREMTLRRAGVAITKEIKVRGKTRSPANDDEAFAAGAMVRLAGMDPDFALERNGVGFSKFDGDFGHSLASQVQDTQTKMGAPMLTDRQWAACVKMANKYRGQVGTMPSKA